MGRRRIRPSELGADRPTRGPGYASSPMENECRRCGRDVERKSDWRPSRGGWICRWCVSGADDE